MTRDPALDRLRGLAILLMVTDHLALLLEADLVRWTVGRVAMPLFFVLGGHLARRYSWRLLEVVAVGLLVQLVAPWTGALVLLLTFTAGHLLTVLCRSRPGLPLLLIVVLAAVSANVPVSIPGAYGPLELVVIMLAGSLLSREFFQAAGSRLPAWLAWSGRRPLMSYAVTSAAISALALA